MKPIYVIAPLLATVVSCGGNNSSNSQREPKTMAYPYTLVECGKSGNTAIEAPRREVIDDVHRFREVYSVTDLNNQDDVPDIDFETRRVIAIHAGSKGNPGHGLRIDDVVTDGEELTVQYTAIEPNNSGECAYPSVVAYPYCFISVEKSDLPVNYAKQTEEGSC